MICSYITKYQTNPIPNNIVLRLREKSRNHLQMGKILNLLCFVINHKRETLQIVIQNSNYLKCHSMQFMTKEKHQDGIAHEFLGR